MVSQYPYILQVLSITGTKDENGNWIAGTENWINLTRCRDEAGSGKKVTGIDGSSHDYSFLIQMPQGVEAIAAGTKVRVVDGAAVRATGLVIYSRKDQFHSRVWV